MAHVMSDPNSGSAIKVTDDLEAAISKAGSVEAIQHLLHEAALSQGLVQRDNDPNIFIPVEQPTPRGYAKTLTINGTKHIIEGATEAELVANELAKMKELFAPAAASDEPQRDNYGRFRARQSEVDAAEQAAQLLEEEDPAARAQADVVRRALEAQGIDVDALKEYTASKQDERMAQSWSDAAERFRNSPAGENWPGGKRNQQTISEIILENGLVETDDKVGAMEAAYKFMVENNLVAENPELKALDAIRNATDYESLKQAVGYKNADINAGGGFFGR